MRKLKNKIKGNFRKNVTKAAIIAAAGFGAVSVSVPAFAAEMQHHCSCGENHDDPNCTCGCQEAKALVALTQGEYETSQATLSEKLEAQKKLQEQLDAAKKVHEEYVEALKAAIAENEAKAQAALDEAQAVLDSANAASEEAQAAFTAAQTEYDEALGALREAEEAYSALEETNPDIENEYNEAINALEEAQKELDQAVQEEEEAQTEKDEADKQAEDARKKREDARSARERAKEAADAAEKRRAEAQEAKQAADEALSTAQEKYNSADEAYSYKKGLADGTIPIETTPEWEEAKKTQEALDAATADKEKADAELKTAENDLSAKEKSLEEANADYEEKSKVCEETREQLRKAREELEAAQQENKEDKEALDAAKSEKDAADKDVKNKTNELAAADKALEDAKKAQGDAQKALEDAEKAKKEAEEALQKHKDEQRNSVAFCKWVVENSKDENLVKDAQAALDIYEKHMGEGAATKLTGETDLTDEKDAANLDNMLESLKFLEETNALRKHEGVGPLIINGYMQGAEELRDLRVSLRLMMIAQLQLNWSDSNEDHSGVENVGENLAWGQQNKAIINADLNDSEGKEAGPFAGWYTDEKVLFESKNPSTDFKRAYEATIIAKEASIYAKDAANSESAKQELIRCLNDLKKYASSILLWAIDDKKGDYVNSEAKYQWVIDSIEKNIINLKEFERELQEPSFPSIAKDGAGHYLNIVNANYNITGFAYNQGAAAKYGSRAYGQTFSTDRSNPEAYPTVEAFSALLNRYADKTNTEQEELEKAVEAAKKALEDANTSLTNAKQDVTDKTNEKTAAQKALDDSEKNQSDKTKALEDATAKEATSAKRVADAETALGLRTEENDTAEQDLTAAEEVKNTAQEEKDTAAGVKDEKQKEADSKNETFTEAKGKDDAADRAVQDLLDGKEVPALEQEANAAKEELDKATGDQAAAATELKAAEDDSKAKSDDLSAKTAEEEAAVKDQEDKEAAAKAKGQALTSAIENKNAKEGIKNAAEEKAAETKKRLDDKNNAETAKNNAQTKSDDAKAKADDAKSKADAAASDAAKANTDANSAKQALDAAKALNADDALKSDDDSYNQFKEAIDAVKGAIVSEDDANAKYTEAEAESVVAEADEKTKKEAYDNAVTAYASVHEHCGHDEMQVAYSCTQGNGNVWTKGSGVTSDFTFTRAHMDETAFDHFTGVSVDGKALDKSAYTASSGSVIVKLSDKFLETLAVGDHTIKVEFDDGSAEAKFTVRAASGSGTVTETKKTTPVKTVGAVQQVITTPSANVQTAQKAPATGDTGAAVWIISAAASAAVIAGAVLYRRKRADRG